MRSVNCPSCGTSVSIPPNKSGFPWWGGCLIAVAVIPTVIAVIGILAAIAIPSFVKSKNHAQRSACFANMKMIDSAKEQWALSQGSTNDHPDESALAPYLPNAGTPLCPNGGTYTYNTVGQEAECSEHGTISDPSSNRHSPQAHHPSH